MRHGVVVIVLAAATACASGAPVPTASDAFPTESPDGEPVDLSTLPPEPTDAPTAPPAPPPPQDSSRHETTERAAAAARPRPAWLGTKALPRRPDGFGEIRPTPKTLRDRRLVTPDALARPDDDRYRATIARVPPDVRRRSTWNRGCPVALDDLRYVTVTFLGFDGNAHTGELMVHRAAAKPLAGVFRRLYQAQFPIEEMRIVTPADVDAPPTGDGNNTTSFVCRVTRTSTSWSQHAYGLAVDVNPFHNPYVKDDLVLPELASAYTDRDDRRPGMVHDESVVTRAFDDIGWGWGGRWTSLKDWMHFSANGR